MVAEDVQDVVHGVPHVEVGGCRRGGVCYLRSQGILSAKIGAGSHFQNWQNHGDVVG